jgi:hypothetical protein
LTSFETADVVLCLVLREEHARRGLAADVVKPRRGEAGRGIRRAWHRLGRVRYTFLAMSKVLRGSPKYWKTGINPYLF